MKLPCCFYIFFYLSIVFFQQTELLGFNNKVKLKRAKSIFAPWLKKKILSDDKLVEEFELFSFQRLESNSFFDSKIKESVLLSSTLEDFYIKALKFNFYRQGLDIKLIHQNGYINHDPFDIQNIVASKIYYSLRTWERKQKGSYLFLKKFFKEEQEKQVIRLKLAKRIAAAKNSMFKIFFKYTPAESHLMNSYFIEMRRNEKRRYRSFLSSESKKSSRKDDFEDFLDIFMKTEEQDLALFEQGAAPWLQYTDSLTWLKFKIEGKDPVYKEVLEFRPRDPNYFLSELKEHLNLCSLSRSCIQKAYFVEAIDQLILRAGFNQKIENVLELLLGGEFDSIYDASWLDLSEPYVNYIKSIERNFPYKQYRVIYQILQAEFDSRKKYVRSNNLSYTDDEFYIPEVQRALSKVLTFSLLWNKPIESFEMLAIEGIIDSFVFSLEEYLNFDFRFNMFHFHKEVALDKRPVDTPLTLLFSFMEMYLHKTQNFDFVRRVFHRLNMLFNQIGGKSSPQFEDLVSFLSFYDLNDEELLDEMKSFLRHVNLIRQFKGTSSF